MEVPKCDRRFLKGFIIWLAFSSTPFILSQGSMADWFRSLWSLCYDYPELMADRMLLRYEEFRLSKEVKLTGVLVEGTIEMLLAYNKIVSLFFYELGERNWLSTLNHWPQAEIFFEVKWPGQTSLEVVWTLNTQVCFFSLRPQCEQPRRILCDIYSVFSFSIFSTCSWLFQKLEQTSPMILTDEQFMKFIEMEWSCVFPSIYSTNVFLVMACDISDSFARQLWLKFEVPISTETQNEHCVFKFMSLFWCVFVNMLALCQANA